jgi:hypothetical protein
MQPKLPLMQAWFIVFNMTFNPHECTIPFGLDSSEVSIKGEKPKQGIRLTLSSDWSIGTQRGAFDSTNKPLQLLLSTVWPKRKRIRDFARKNGLKIMFRLDTIGALGQRNFLLVFSALTIKQISYFGSRLDLDIY